MADKAHFVTLFDYHWHTTRHLLECAVKLDTADYTAESGYGHGSIHTIFIHLLLTDRGWRVALETGKQPAPLSFDEYPDLAALQRGYADEQADWQTLFAGWNNDDIAGDVTLTRWGGGSTTFALWRVLQHLSLHGMQHHSELAYLLTSKGHSPGNIDFLFFQG